MKQYIRSAQSLASTGAHVEETLPMDSFGYAFPTQVLAMVVASHFGLRRAFAPTAVKKLDRVLEGSKGPVDAGR